MNRDDFLMLHDQLVRKARILVEAKNRDYGANEDPFRNFRRWGLLGIVVRLGDKIARLETFVERGDLLIADEQARDTVLDIINYAVLFEGYNQDADRKGSNSGDAPGEIGPWTVPKGHDKELHSFLRGSWRSGAGGGGDHTFAPAQRAAAHTSTKFKGRTGAVRGGNKHVGGKHRQRGGKGRK